MKKQALSLLLALSLMSVPALAKENSADNFVRGKTYAGQFSDLPEDHTFYENVAALYEYGLSVGQADGTYGLTVPMTVGQSVIFAGRIRSLYRTGDPEAGPAAFTAAAADFADGTDVTVENTFADLLAGAVIQLDLIVVPHLHHAVVEAEYLSGVHDLRRLRRCGVDLLADGFIQAVDRCLALRAERR